MSAVIVLCIVKHFIAGSRFNLTASDICQFYAVRRGRSDVFALKIAFGEFVRSMFGDRRRPRRDVTWSSATLTVGSPLLSPPLLSPPLTPLSPVSYHHNLFFYFNNAFRPTFIFFTKPHSIKKSLWRINGEWRKRLW